jgi:3-oxoacyl-[acyl-carrier protein] reductase
MMENARPRVLITGAAGGIGQAVAREFLRLGAAVALLDRDSDSLLALADTLAREFFGATIATAVADVTDEEALPGAVRGLIDDLGGLDTLVVNAGVMSRTPFAELDTARFGEVLHINVLGAYRTVLSALPDLCRSAAGSIVIVSSAGGLNPRSVTGPAYRVSKASLIALTKVLAVELLPVRIRVNCVAPGGVDGGMSVAFSAEELKGMRETSIDQRLASTEEVAGSVVFLAGPDSSFTTGAVLVVAGGAFI